MDADTGAGTGLVPGIIGVGYGGIRIISRDQGKTWGSRSSFAVDGGDDQNLLRAVAYGKGMWIATGWKLVTSIDGGLTWSDHGMIAKLEPRPPCNIVEGLALERRSVYGACAVGTTGGCSDLPTGSGGPRWPTLATPADTCFWRTPALGFLRMATRGRRSYRTMRCIGRANRVCAPWDLLRRTRSKSAAECGDEAGFRGSFFEPEWKGKIRASTTGRNSRRSMSTTKTIPCTKGARLPREW